MYERKQNGEQAVASALIAEMRALSPAERAPNRERINATIKDLQEMQREFGGNTSIGGADVDAEISVALTMLIHLRDETSE